MELRTKGILLVGTTAILYVYYFVWLFIMPFVDEGTPIQSYFPDRKYGYMFSTLLLVFIVAIVCAFVGLALVNAGNSESKKNALKTEKSL